MDAGERGRHGSHSGEDPGPEPEQAVGGSDWLLQQLSGGRLRNLLETPQPDAAETPATDAADAPVGDSAEVLDSTEFPDSAEFPENTVTSEAESSSPASVESVIPPRAPEQIIDEDPVAAAAFASSLTDESGPTEFTPTSAESTSADGVYQWPAGGAGADPFVWEDVAPEAPSEADDEEDEFWRAAVGDPNPSAPPVPGGFAWNLTPSATVDDETLDPESTPNADGLDEQTWQPDIAPSTVDAPTVDAELVDPGYGDDEELPELIVEPEVVVHESIPDGEGYDEYDDEDSVDDSDSRFAPLAATGAAGFATTPALQHVNHTAPEGHGVSSSGSPELRNGSRRPLIIAAASLGVIVVLGGLLLLGMFVAGQGQPAAAPAPAASATPTPTPTVALPTVGPLPAGTYAWDQLLGGECLQPMTDVWAEDFTVVDCSGEHAAQVVRVAEVSGVSAFPGADQMAALVATACQADGVVDIAAAEAYGDVQVQGTFPVTNEQWVSGEKDYYCFVNRAGGGALAGSLVPAV